MTNPEDYYRPCNCSCHQQAWTWPAISYEKEIKEALERIATLLENRLPRRRQTKGKNRGR